MSSNFRRGQGNAITSQSNDPAELLNFDTSTADYKSVKAIVAKFSLVTADQKLVTLVDAIEKAKETLKAKSNE